MELIQRNYLDTTTQLSFALAGNAAIQSYLFNPDRRLQYFTDGASTDASTGSIKISFSSTTTIDRIALIEHNLREFTIFYNGATANLLTLTGPTTSSSFTGNSATDSYFKLATPLAVTSLTFDLKKTIVANNEKAIGLLIVSSAELVFPRLPAASGYTPTIEPKQIIHTMSDGGTRVHHVSDKWKTRLSFKYITESFRDSLRAVYDQHTAFVFVPFDTATAWDGIAFESTWTNGFNFYKLSDNAPDAGYTGDIELKET